MKKNVLIIFIGLLLFISCKITQDKENYEIPSIIYITDWGEKAIDRKKIQLYAIDSLKRSKQQKIKEIRVYDRDAAREANTLIYKIKTEFSYKIII